MRRKKKTSVMNKVLLYFSPQHGIVDEDEVWNVGLTLCHDVL